MRTPGAFRAAAAALLLAAPASAAENAGVTTASFLKIPVGARAMGMGGAFTAIPGDLHGGWYNPAGLGALRRIQVSAMAMGGIEDSSSQHLGLAVPLPGSVLSEWYPAVLSAGAFFYKVGEFEVNRTNPDGSFAGTETLTAEKDFVGTVSVAQLVFEDPYRSKGETRTRRHYLGGTAKYIRSTLAESYRAEAAAVDLGYLADHPEAGISAGVSLLNLGSELRYIEDGDPLPTAARVGGALTRGSRVGDWTLAGDFEHQLHERQNRAQFGLEYRYGGFFALRTGLRLGEEDGGFTFGFGLYRPNFSFDFSWAENKTFEPIRRLTLSFAFDPPWAFAGRGARTPAADLVPVPSTRQLDPVQIPTRRLREDPEDLPIVPGWMR